MVSMSNPCLQPQVSLPAYLLGRSLKVEPPRNVKTGKLRQKLRYLFDHTLPCFYQLPSIVLSRADIKAGYIILKNASRIAIKSNNKKGCMVVFKGLKWPFKEAHAFGLAHDAHITPEGASVQQPYKKNTQNVELSYRFILSDNATAGKHLWPLSIALQAL